VVELEGLGEGGRRKWEEIEQYKDGQISNSSN